MLSGIVCEGCVISGSVRKFERSRMLFVCAVQHVCALQLFRVGFLSLWGA
jgi:hypothetical protein